MSAAAKPCGAPSAARSMRLDVDLSDPVRARVQGAPAPSAFSVEVRYMVPDDQQQYLPSRSRAPALIPPEAPLPQLGHVIYLSSSSAWGVEMVTHEWCSPVDLRIAVWITHVGSSRTRRQTGFGVTQ